MGKFAEGERKVLMLLLFSIFINSVAAYAMIPDGPADEISLVAANS